MLQSRWLNLLAVCFVFSVDPLRAVEVGSLQRPLLSSPLVDSRPQETALTNFGFQTIDAIIEEQHRSQHTTTITGIDYRLAWQSMVSEAGWSLRPNVRYREVVYESESSSQLFEQDFRVRSSQELWETHVGSELRYTVMPSFSIAWQPELSSVHQKYQSSFRKDRSHFRYRRQTWSLSYWRSEMMLTARYQTSYHLTSETLRIREPATSGLDMFWIGERQNYGLRFEFRQHQIQDSSLKDSWLLMAGLERSMGPKLHWALYGEYSSPAFKNDESARAATLGGLGFHGALEFLAYEEARVAALFEFNSAKHRGEESQIDFLTQRFQIQFEYYLN